MSSMGYTGMTIYVYCGILQGILIAHILHDCYIWFVIHYVKQTLTRPYLVRLMTTASFIYWSLDPLFFRAILKI